MTKKAANDNGLTPADEWDDPMDHPVNLKVKEYKCATCHGRCVGEKRALLKTVENCRFTRTGKTCGLAHFAQWLVDFDNKMEKKAKVPALLLPDYSKGKMVETQQNEDGSYEVVYPDPIRILVNKKGHKDVISGDQ